MSQVALYRRWRPQAFADVLGQEAAVRTLQAAIRDDRVAHAYLFSGPRGTGKTSAARIFAKALNCEKGPADEPCNACETCRLITEGASLDVIEIDAATHGGVDDVRELRENALLSPATARRKVYIIDEAHMITPAGWNAFLKTVEEPPPHVIFVFATTEAHKVLATISSRCQQFDFRRVSSGTIAAHLATVCEAEGAAFDEAALHLVSRHAEGGVRDALSILDQLISSGSVTVESAAALLGSATGDVLVELAESLASRDAAGALSVVARLVEEGRDLRLFTRQVLDHLRGLFLMREVREAEELIDATEEARAELAAQADRFGSAQLVHLMRLFTEALADMRQQAAPRLTVEMAIVRATVAGADDSAQAALARIERLERLLEIGAVSPAAKVAPAGEARPARTAEPEKPAKTAKPEPDKPAKPSKEKKAAAKPSGARASTAEAAEPADEPSAGAAASLVDLGMVRRSWTIVLEEVRKRSPRIHALLAEAKPVRLEGGVLELQARFSFHANEIVQTRNVVALSEALQEVLGVTPRISTSVAGEPDADADGDEIVDSVDPLEALRDGLGAEVIDEA